MLSVTNPSLNTTNYEYYPDTQNLHKVNYPNGVTTEYTYNNLGWITSVVTKDSTLQVLSSFTYDTHDNVGNRQHILEELRRGDGVLFTSEVTYEYDDAYRLTDEVRAGADAYSISFTYDKVGNRLTQTRNSTLTEYTYNSRNQLLTTNSELITTNYGYDLNGNLASRTTGANLTTYGWNKQGKLSTVYGIQDTVYYFYDGDGNQRGGYHSQVRTQKDLDFYSFRYILTSK